MKKLAMTFISALTALALASPLHAAGELNKSEPLQQADPARSMSVEQFQGMQVVSQNGEKIGKIIEAHSDNQSGQIQFVTVAKDDADRENVAVPLEALRFNQESRQATLKVAESKLENAPKQADKSMQVYLFELLDHYGVAPAWQEDARIMGPPVPPIDVPGQQTDSQ